jgi:hypothetical protein
MVHLVTSCKIIIELAWKDGIAQWWFVYSVTDTTVRCVVFHRNKSSAVRLVTSTLKNRLTKGLRLGRTFKVSGKSWLVFVSPRYKANVHKVTEKPCKAETDNRE